MKTNTLYTVAATMYTVNGKKHRFIFFKLCQNIAGAVFETQIAK